MRRTLEQERAADALTKVTDLEQKAAGNSKQVDINDRYAQEAKGLPATIIMNGLGQAMATLRAGKDEHNGILYRHCQEWLCRNDAKAAPYPGQRDLLPALTAGSREDYLRAQNEALAWLNWLKKFATAYLPKPDKQGGGSQ